MRTIRRTLAVVVATVMIAAIPVLAEERAVEMQEPLMRKSDCLLIAKNCPTDSIHERIDRIQTEIGKGNAVYTNDELRQLERELNEAQKLLHYEQTDTSPSLMF